MKVNYIFLIFVAILPTLLHLTSGKLNQALKEVFYVT